MGNKDKKEKKPVEKKGKSAEKKDTKGNGKGKAQEENKKSNPLYKDKRFSSAAKDPRFKIVDTPSFSVDERFSHMFSGSQFSDAGKVDKYGRKIAKDTQEKELNKLYRIDQDKGKGKGKDTKTTKKAKVESESEGEASEESEEDVEDVEDVEEEEEAENSEVSDEQEEELSGSGSELDDDIDQIYQEQMKYVDEMEEAPVGDDETKRLAVLNFEWQAVRAVDLLVLFNSFLPPKGQIKRVTVYPSKFGLERMAKEEKGILDLWTNKEESAKRKGAPLGGQTSRVKIDKRDKDDDEDEDADELDADKVRRSTMNSYKYYFAVVECDKVATASHLYNQLDGMEFENMALPADCRFIPDGEKFTQKPRDTVNAVPVDYVAPDIWSKVASTTNYEISWDRDNPNRNAALHFDPLSRESMKEMSYNDFVATVDSSEDEDEDEDDEEEQEETDKKKKGKKAKVDSDEEDEEEDEEDEEGEEGDEGDEGWDSKKFAVYDSDAESGSSEEETKPSASKKKAKEEKLKRERAKIRAKYAVLLDGLTSKDDKDEDLKITFGGLEKGLDIDDDPFFDRRKATKSFADEDDEEADAMMDHYLGGDDMEDEVDKEMSFTPGLSNVAQDLLNQKEKKNMSSWEKYLEKAAEKKKTRKKEIEAKRKGYIEEHRAALKGFDPKEKFKPKELTEEEQKQKAQLELLVADFEHTKDKKHKVASKRADDPTAAYGKSGSGKALKSKRNDDDDDGDDVSTTASTVNTADSRFSAMFNNPDFAPDPTHPKFKKTAGMETVMQELNKRRREESEKPRIVKDITSSQPSSRSTADLVASVKQKANNFSKPNNNSNGKPNKHNNKQSQHKPGFNPKRAKHTHF